jgi:hypothetical protein
MYFTEDFRLIPSARSVELKRCFRLESESRKSCDLNKAQSCRQPFFRTWNRTM